MHCEWLSTFITIALCIFLLRNSCKQLYVNETPTAGILRWRKGTSLTVCNGGSGQGDCLRSLPGLAKPTGQGSPWRSTVWISVLSHCQLWHNFTVLAHGKERIPDCYSDKSKVNVCSHQFFCFWLLLARALQPSSGGSVQELCCGSEKWLLHGACSETAVRPSNSIL